MTVLLDGIIFSLQRHGGISVYMRELLQRLSRDAAPTVLTLEGGLQQEAPRVGRSVTTVARPARVLERYRPCRVPSGPAPEVFHSSYYRKPDNASLPTIVTVHDFTYERMVVGPRRWVHSAQKFAAIRAAQEVICISRSTLEDLQEFVGMRSDQRVRVIHNGVADAFQPMALPAAAVPFILFVGLRSGYKNFRLVLQALAHLPDIQLQCVGGGDLLPRELAAVSDDVRRRVRHAGYVSDADLNRMYNQALCLVYPSRYEGFGIPVLEAMRAGCPVVSIRCRAVVEIGLDALTVSADDPEELARSIELLADHEYRAERVKRGLAVAAGYSWEDCYRATVQVYLQYRGVQ